MIQSILKNVLKVIRIESKLYQTYSSLGFKLICFVLFLILVSCHSNHTSEYLFKAISSTSSGITFSNRITPTKENNILNFHYIYNGGGVGIGDFNKDGLSDIVFTANESGSKIYLNNGNFTFSDITHDSSFNPIGWATGVSVADINGDSWDDIYISVGGMNCNGQCKNQLFIHQGLNAKGIPIFKESASKYKLDDGLYTQQTVFFDYDADGDLDAYLCQNVIDNRDKNAPSEKKFINKNSADKLLENMNGVFQDVSESRGISNRGYGLGVTLADFNKDQLPDIYVANDFLSDDLIYINKGMENGVHLGFEEKSQSFLKHQSYNSMGVDVADINNDLLPDVFVVDMMPHYYERQKSMIGVMNYDKYLLSLRQGYAAQFIKNSLQLHNGFINKTVLPFSDIAYMAGVHDSDWSWAPLMADFDNDGDKDIFITNGYGKDITDLDFINFSNQQSGFGSKESTLDKLYNQINLMDDVRMSNMFFENIDTYSFEDRTTNWVQGKKSISNGAVYVDLDNDGDLDIITNNINEEATILKNTSKKANYLKITLIGDQKNISGIGASVSIWSNGKSQHKYHSPVKGYLSSLSHQLHFGLHEQQIIDSIHVDWPTGQQSIHYDVSANQNLSINIVDASRHKSHHRHPSQNISLQPDTSFRYTHVDNEFHDYITQPLLIKQLSKEGPCLAAADINGNGNEELFIGGSKGEAARIYAEDDEGQWTYIELTEPQQEDIAATYMDIDQDGDQDLYVVSGSSEYSENDSALTDRLYINNGSGLFKLNDNQHLPRFNGGCVAAEDFDQDGDIDIFVGGRSIPRRYPTAPTSTLLINKHGQLQSDSTGFHLDTKSVGMVTDALWADMDQNGWKDLVISIEWGSILIYYNNQGRLSRADDHRLSELNKYKGLWSCIQAADFDQDGDIDLVAGNLGMNTKFQASSAKPLYIVNTDLDKNGSIDPLIGQYVTNKGGESVLYPLHAKDDIAKQLPKLLKGNVSYADFSKLTFKDICQQQIESNTLTATTLRSFYIENVGDSGFRFTALPAEAQLSQVQDSEIIDINNDSYLDILLIGNNYTAEKNYGRYDSFNGLVLHGTGNGQFISVPTQKSGFLVAGDAREIVILNAKINETLIVVAQNSGPAALFKPATATTYN